MKDAVERKKRELADLEDKKERYINYEARNYRERLYFAYKRLFSLDYDGREDFLNEVSIIAKFSSGLFLFLLVTVLSLKYLGVIGWLGTLSLFALMFWIASDNELEIRSD